MDEMLRYTDHLPEIDYNPGDIVIHEGGDSTGVWILVSGSLQVLKNGEEVNQVNRPGALIGEMSILLGIPDSATVVAAEPSRMRYAAKATFLIEARSK